VRSLPTLCSISLRLKELRAIGFEVEVEWAEFTS